MSSKQKVVFSFADKLGIIDVNYMSKTAKRLESDRPTVFHNKSLMIM